MSKKNEQEINSDKKSKSPVPAVEKALDVVELLADAPDGLTMNELVDQLNRTMGEIYRIVIYLTDRGYLKQNHDTSRYTLTLRLFELSHRHDPTERLIRAGLPILERIAARTNQSSHLGVLNRSNILVLTSVQSPLPAGYSVRTGALFPVSQTSSGHVILAFSSKAEQKQYISSLEGAARDDLQKRLAQIRTDGYEDTPSTMIHGVRNLCVPVFDARGITAAITSGFIGQTENSTSAEETLSTIRLAALDLSNTLGFQLENSPFHSVLTP